MIVRIQSWWRMVVVLCKYRYKLQERYYTKLRVFRAWKLHIKASLSHKVIHCQL